MDMASDSDTASVWSNSSSVVTRTTTTSSSSVRDGRELDPLLQDLNGKKQDFRRNVVSLASELKQVRRRLSSQELSYTKEALTRQEAEEKARKLEKEINQLQQSLEERNGQLKASATAAQEYLKELDIVKQKLEATQAIAEASNAAAQSAQHQCVVLVKELAAREISLNENENRVNQLAKHLAVLHKDLMARESSQNLLKDEVLRIEGEITQALVKAGTNSECELRRLLEEVSPKNFEKMNKLLDSKDEEVAKLKDEIRTMSAEWQIKTKELELQLEKHRKTDQDLKKRVLKLEFCLQEARAQNRKLQRMGERRDKAIKELQDQLVTKQQRKTSPATSVPKQNFWETSNFKIAASMSMLVLVIFSKR